MTQILNRFTGAVITEGDMNLRELVLYYVKTERNKGMGADLRGAYLRGADLGGAYLRGADLRGAYLRGADLQGVKISNADVFTGLYAYLVMPVIAEDGTEYIRMGCFFRTVVEWETDFWNNPKEFPNNGDTPSKLRWMAYQTALAWLDINREVAHDEKAND